MRQRDEEARTAGPHRRRLDTALRSAAATFGSRASTGASARRSRRGAGKRPCSSAGAAASSTPCEVTEGEIQIVAVEDELGAGCAGHPCAGGRGQRLGGPAVLDRQLPGEADGRCGHAAGTLVDGGRARTPGALASVADAPPRRCRLLAARDGRDLLGAGARPPVPGDRADAPRRGARVMVARRPLGELLETVQLVRGGAPLHFLLVALVERARRRPDAPPACSRRSPPAWRSSRRAARAGAASARSRASSRLRARRSARSPSTTAQFARMYALFLARHRAGAGCLVRALDEGGRWWAGAAALPGARRLRAPLRRGRRHRRGRGGAGRDPPPSSRADRWRAPLLTGLRHRRSARCRWPPATSCSPRATAPCTRPTARPLPHAADARHGAPGVRQLLRVPRADALLTPTGPVR